MGETYPAQMPPTLTHTDDPASPGGTPRRMSGLRRRAGTLRDAFDRHGLKGVAVAAAGHLPPRLAQVQWYSIVETIPPGTPDGTRALDARRAGPEDVAVLASVGHASAEELRGRLANGDTGFVGFEGPEAVGYFWYRAGAWREDDIEFRLRDDERWGYDAFVRPSRRGTGVAPALAIHSLARLQTDGVVRVLAVIDHLNEASRRASVRYGGRPIASLTTIGILGVGLVRERRAGARRSSTTLYRRRRGLVRRPPASPAAP